MPSQKVVVSEVTETRHTCDILFKPIREEDIYKKFSSLNVSHDAFRLLPPDFRHDTILERVVWNCGERWGTFHPCMLWEGVWFLSRDHLSRANGYYMNPHTPAKEETIQSVEEAEKIIKDRGCGKAWIFKDGKLVKYLRSRVVYEEFPWPPPAKVKIEDAK